MSNAWRELVTYSSGFEADMTIARLEAEEIPAIRDSNDSAGIFGAGYQGSWMRGVKVLVPEAFYDEAKALLDELSP